jgi:signal transduction histidine kinase
MATTRYLARGLVLGGAGALVLVAVAAVALLCLAGVGLLLVGVAVTGVRRVCDADRRRVTARRGRRVLAPYPAGSTLRASDVRRHVEAAVLGRDLVALASLVVVAVPLGLVGVLLPLVALNALAIPFYWWAMPDGSEVGSIVLVTGSWWSALANGLVGLAGLALWRGLRPVADLDCRVRSRLLSSSPGQQARARTLAEERRRRAAVSAHTAELRRIERDLHDAAQNRLVAVVMFLGLARRQIEAGRPGPLASIDSAQAAATDALDEVRRIIGGIYPPVLAEEGLVPALGLLVDRSPVPARLHVGEPRATPAAVDSALYHAVAEALTNVAEHSGASACDVELRWADDDDGVAWAVATVTDDGHGGAEPGAGTGLDGIRRRVEALAGRVSVDSPAGGPTTLTVEVPCVS